MPDTLDVRRYFPLEVGNEWHYSGTGFASPIPFYERHRVVSDTIVGSTTYFIHVWEEFNYDRQLGASTTRYLRYNPLGTVISLRNLEDDHSGRDTTSAWYASAFGDTLRFENGAYIVEGEYGASVWITGGTVAARKTLYLPIPPVPTEYFAATSRATDIGMIWESHYHGPDIILSYARISGVEYGEPIFALGSAGSNSTAGHHVLEVFPNPARDAVHVRWSLSNPQEVTVRLHDVLGREVAEFDADGCVQECGRTIDVSELSKGIYFLSVGDDSFRTSRAVIVH